MPSGPPRKEENRIGGRSKDWGKIARGGVGWRGELGWGRTGDGVVRRARRRGCDGPGGGGKVASTGSSPAPAEGNERGMIRAGESSRVNICETTN